MGEYQHYIPQFVLRQFCGPHKTQKQRRKEGRKAWKKGQPDPESVMAFNLESRSIQHVAIRKVFGVENFYEDVNCSEDPRHLETKLGFLEGEASRVIRDLHKAATKPGNQHFTLPRSDLQILRRFIFIMHYRNKALDETYFREDHPNNVSLRNWIRKVKMDNGYTDDRQIWLRGLQYYLETPHNDILAHAKALQKDIPHAELDIDTPLEHCFAGDYQLFADNYYMGIWQASEKSEFVLGHNSYGLWEGTILGTVPQLFRIYVISPSITLVLKLNQTKDPIFRAMEDSTLSNHPLQVPAATYYRPPGDLSNLSATPGHRFDALQLHLQSSNSAKDQFCFTINRLSADQTYLVNQVVLENLHSNGSLVFRSKNAMLQIAQRYDTPEGPFRKKNRNRIAALVACLTTPAASPGTLSNQGPEAVTTMPLQPGPPPPLIALGEQNNRKVIRPKMLLGKRLLGSAEFWQVSEYDTAFNDLLVDILEGSIEFRSDYDRAQLVWNFCPRAERTRHPFALCLHPQVERSRKYIEVLQAATSLPSSVPAVEYMLVESLSKDDADHLLNLLSLHLEAFERDWHIEEGPETEDEKILKQARVVAYLQLLIHIDHRLATTICRYVSFMVPAVVLRDQPREETQPVKQVAEQNAQYLSLNGGRTSEESDMPLNKGAQPFGIAGGIPSLEAFVEEVVTDEGEESADTATRPNLTPKIRSAELDEGGLGVAARVHELPNDELSNTGDTASKDGVWFVIRLPNLRHVMADLAKIHLAWAVITLVRGLVQVIWGAVRGGTEDADAQSGHYFLSTFLQHLGWACLDFFLS